VFILSDTGDLIKAILWRLRAFLLPESIFIGPKRSVKPDAKQAPEPCLGLGRFAAPSAQKKLASPKTPACVRQFFIKRMYCELMKNYRLTKTKTQLEEKNYEHLYYTRRGSFGKKFFQLFDSPACRTRKCKSQISRIKIVESLQDDFLNFSFCTLIFAAPSLLLYGAPTGVTP
jgi:hypothetical protein